MKKISFIILLYWICTLNSNTSGHGLTEHFPEIEGWTLIPGERVYVPSNLWDLINGAADSYLSYDFRDLHLADYQNDEGINVRVELYRHSTFENTFGIYTSERNPDYNFIDIGTQGYLEEDVLNFLCGYYYVKITTNSKGDSALKSMVEIAKNVQQYLKQAPNWPGIFEIFPPGMIKYSEHYIAENFLGFRFLHSAFTADYHNDGEDFQVFVIQTNEPEEVNEMLRSYLEFTKQDQEVKDGTFLVTDPYNGDINIILKGNSLAGIINCNDDEIVEEYINMLRDKI